MGEKVRHLTLPLTEAEAVSLRAGESVLLSGTLYAARDEAHEKMIALLEEGRDLPFAIKDACIYYVGPAPAAPGRVIGSAGPTTSGRMDAFTPALIRCGLRGMIGKGERSPEVIEAMNGARETSEQSGAEIRELRGERAERDREIDERIAAIEAVIGRIDRNTQKGIGKERG